MSQTLPGDHRPPLWPLQIKSWVLPVSHQAGKRKTGWISSAFIPCSRVPKSDLPSCCTCISCSPQVPPEEATLPSLHQQEALPRWRGPHESWSLCFGHLQTAWMRSPQAHSCPTQGRDGAAPQGATHHVSSHSLKLGSCTYAACWPHMCVSCGSPWSLVSGFVLGSVSQKQAHFLHWYNSNFTDELKGSSEKLNGPS